jgi:hypothetical protein
MIDLSSVFFLKIGNFHKEFLDICRIYDVEIDRYLRVIILEKRGITWKQTN